MSRSMFVKRANHSRKGEWGCKGTKELIHNLGAQPTRLLQQPGLGPVEREAHIEQGQKGAAHIAGDVDSQTLRRNNRVTVMFGEDITSKPHNNRPIPTTPELELRQQRAF